MEASRLVPVRACCYSARVRNEFGAFIEGEGDWYIAYAFEIPGANGQGRTRDEALEPARSRRADSRGSPGGRPLRQSRLLLLRPRVTLLPGKLLAPRDMIALGTWSVTRSSSEGEGRNGR